MFERVYLFIDVHKSIINEPFITLFTAGHIEYIHLQTNIPLINRKVKNVFQRVYLFIGLHKTILIPPLLFYSCGVISKPFAHVAPEES